MPSVRTRLRKASELPDGTLLAAGDAHIVLVDHGDGARSRFEPETACAVKRGRTRGGSRPVVVDLGEGCAWFDGTAGTVFEIRRPGVAVVAGPATVAVTGEPDGSTAVVVVTGHATIEPDEASPEELDRQAALITADGKVRQVIDLTPSDLASDRWVVANRLLDAEWHSTEQEAAAEADEAEPPRRRRWRTAVAGVTAAALLLGAVGALVAGLTHDHQQAAAPATTVTTATPSTTAPSTSAKPAPTTTATPTPTEPPLDVKLDSCHRSGGQVVFAGRVTNQETATHTYRVDVAFLDAQGTVVERTSVSVRAAPGETVPWQATSTEGSRLSGGNCAHERTTVTQ